MSEDRKNLGKHLVTLLNRENITLTGVVDVISFDEETIVTDTTMGVLIIHGVNLHVNRLNLESGELEVDGEIASLNYEDQNSYTKGKTSAFLGKLFK